MQFNCPVCNKGGLPDYTATPTICPQCNSDLKAFLLLHSISKPKPTKTILFSLSGIVLVAFAFAFLYFNSLSNRKKIASNNSRKVAELQDSINKIQSANTQKIQPENKSSEKEFVILYKVKNGDYAGKISRLFYNDWRMYKKIEADNNLQKRYVLKVGQPLTIKLKKE